MSLLDSEHILNERTDLAVNINTWAAEYANDFISNIRFMGAVNSLPKLSEDMIGEIYLLKYDDVLETYVAVSNNSGQLRWLQLNSSIEV